MNEDIINKFNELISKYIKKDKINHAYLIETNYNNRLLLGDLLINKILSFENNVSINDLKIKCDQ